MAAETEKIGLWEKEGGKEREAAIRVMGKGRGKERGGREGGGY